MRVIRIELHPVLVLELHCVLILKGNYRSILLFIRPVPQRDCLRFIVAERGQISVIRGQVKAPDTVRMRIQEGTNWRSRQRVPNNKHGVLTAISGDNPALIIGAGSCSNLVTMSLKQFLGLLLVIIDDA